MIALIVSLTLATTLVVLLALDNIHVRHELRQIKQNAAEQVANALGNSVLVDGIELPLPDDDRWKLDQMCDAKDTSKKVTSLRIGLVIVGEYRIWVALNAPSLPITNATEKYCSAVWKAYRSRVARKSIDSAQ
jgi:hypothetical protein